MIAIEPYTQATDAINLAGRGIPAGLRVLGHGEEDVLKLRRCGPSDDRAGPDRRQPLLAALDGGYPGTRRPAHDRHAYEDLHMEAPDSAPSTLTPWWSDHHHAVVIYLKIAYPSGSTRRASAAVILA